MILSVQPTTTIVAQPLPFASLQPAAPPQRCSAQSPRKYQLAEATIRLQQRDRRNQRLHFSQAAATLSRALR